MAECLASGLCGCFEDRPAHINTVLKNRLCSYPHPTLRLYQSDTPFPNICKTGFMDDMKNYAEMLRMFTDEGEINPNSIDAEKCQSPPMSLDKVLRNLLVIRAAGEGNVLCGGVELKTTCKNEYDFNPFESQWLQPTYDGKAVYLNAEFLSVLLKKMKEKAAIPTEEEMCAAFGFTRDQLQRYESFRESFHCSGMGELNKETANTAKVEIHGMGSAFRTVSGAGGTALL